MDVSHIASRAINGLTDGVVIVSANSAGKKDTAFDDPIIYVNPSFEVITGYQAAEVLGQDCNFLFADDFSQEGLPILRRAIREGKPCISRLRNYRKDGTLFWNDLTLSPVHDDEKNITHFIGILKDVTERELLRQELEALNISYQELNRKLELETETDQLTRVFNRRFMDTAGKMIFETAKREKLSLSLYLVDLDNFKSVNDQYGHKSGDLFLQLVSVMLRDYFHRGNDVIIRYGGDEFIIISTGETRQNAARRGEGLCQWVAKSSLEQREEYFQNSTVSVGVYSATPGPQDTLEKFVREADEALYQSKSAGRNQSTLKGAW